MTDRILRLPEVIEKTGISRSSIYEQMQLGLFPKQLRLGKRMVGWSEAEIEKHLEELFSRSSNS
ncbi:AlpA family phage regulatory protein [Luminiphilus sp.]|nr:AlpA family phage regulatory protein [Luminiphilus sp.]